jgi:hypothetical protein
MMHATGSQSNNTCSDTTEHHRQCTLVTWKLFELQVQKARDREQPAVAMELL